MNTENGGKKNGKFERGNIPKSAAHAALLGSRMIPKVLIELHGMRDVL